MSSIKLGVCVGVWLALPQSTHAPRREAPLAPLKGELAARTG